MRRIFALLFITLFSHSCLGQELIIPSGTVICDRIQAPHGYEREKTEPSSFAKYLRNLPLKKHGSEVKYFDGRVKTNYDVYEAVVDLSIGNKDLHQCADAVMRLRADYLWQNERYEDIHFNFTNGMRVDYVEWMKGKRMVVQGNRTYWQDAAQASNDYSDFWNYMELIFMYAGTHSLSKELLKVDWNDMQIGDVLIQGGFPGHAVIVLDMLKETATGKQLFLLGQSYMPAQELQVLSNPSEPFSPWYSLGAGGVIATPEWTFSSDNLMRFTGQ